LKDPDAIEKVSKENAIRTKAPVRGRSSLDADSKRYDVAMYAVLECELQNSSTDHGDHVKLKNVSFDSEHQDDCPA